MGDVAVVTSEEGVTVRQLESQLQQLVILGKRRIVVHIDRAVSEPLLGAISRVKHRLGSAGGALCISHRPTNESPQLRTIARSTCLPLLLDPGDEVLKALQEV